MFAQCFSKYRQIFPNKSIHNIGCPCLRIVFPNIDRYFPIKVVQQQWFSGNQSTSSVSNMLSPFVSRLSFSLINFWSEKYGYFLLLVYDICVVRVVKCIIKRGGMSLDFVSILLRQKETQIRDACEHSNFFMFCSQRFPIFGTEVLEKRPTPELSMDVPDEPLRC